MGEPRIPPLVSSLLTPQVMQEVVKAYDHRVVFPDRVHVEDPTSAESQFVSAESPVLVLTIENQGVCAWGVPLDDGEDDPPVLVGGDLHGDVSPIVFAADVRAFVDAFRWDAQCLDQPFVLQAQAEPLTPAVLAALRALFSEVSSTFGWPCPENHRFELDDARLMLWSCEGQCDWFASAASLASLRTLATKVLSLSDISKAMWTDNADVDAMLAELREWG